MLKAIVVGRVCYDINIVVDKMPQEGSITEIFEKNGCGGGSGANMAFALAKWGISTAFAGVLGNDVFGTRIRKEFEKVHIDMRYIEQAYENDTPLSVVVINKETGLHTVYNLSDKYIGLKKCDFDFTPDLLVVDGYDVVQAKTVLERFPNCLSVLDASIVTNSVADLMRKVKYAVLTKEFAEGLSGAKIDFQDPKSLIDVYQKIAKKYGRTQFVITLGDKGVMYCYNNQIKVSPSLKVDTVDNFGSGSIFRAAFSYSLAQGWDIEKAVKFGCIAGSLSTTVFGARESIPTLENIMNVYEQNYQ